MEQALIEMAKQIARLQEENERLKKQVPKAKGIKQKKIDPEAEQMARVSRWVAAQYQKGFEQELEKEDVKRRLENIRKDRPGYMPVNDCMDHWPRK